MANAIDAGIWLTAPYGKSLHGGQMRQRDCSNARPGTAHVLPSCPAKAGIQYHEALRFNHDQRGLLDHPPSGSPVEGDDTVQLQQPLGHFALSAAAFLHSDMNFLRSLPWTPLVSASFEHSSDAVVRGFAAFFSAGAIGAVFAAGAGVAGAVACANAEPISSRDAKAAAAAREEIFIMGAPRVEDSRNVALSC
jgi:hypothetical protein